MFGNKVGHLGCVGSLTLAQRVSAMLFSRGEPGAWYDDPSDLSTLFQDSSGAVPVTAVEQPVGLILDKRLGGLARSPLSLVGKTAGDGVVTVVGNVITVTGGTSSTDVSFSIASSFTLLDLTFSAANGITVYAGGYPGLATAGRRTYTGAVGIYNLIRVPAGAPTTTITVHDACNIIGNHASQATTTKRPVYSRRVNLLLATATLATQSMTTTADAYTLVFSGAGSVTLSGAATGTFGAGTYVITCTAGSLTLTVAGAVNDADFRLVVDAHLPYQWVNTATNYDADPAKFPAYRSLDGVDDSHASATGGGGTAGLFFSAAVTPQGGAGTARTLFSDAGTNTGYIVRLNTSNQLELSAGNGTTYTTIATAGTLAVGKTDVVQAWDDGTNLNVKIGNGATASVARPVVSAGTAGYTMGQDNGASTGYFNGRAYSTIYRKDSGLTQVQRESVALYQRQKARIA